MVLYHRDSDLNVNYVDHIEYQADRGLVQLLHIYQTECKPKNRANNIDIEMLTTSNFTSPYPLSQQGFEHHGHRPMILIKRKEAPYCPLLQK